MKNKINYLFAFFFLFVSTSIVSFSQTKIDTVYIKHLSSTVNTVKDSASYFRVRTISNGILKADDYSMQDSSLQCSAYYKKFYPYIKEGYCIYYSPLTMGGAIMGRSEVNYLNDKEEGPWKYYYPSGELCYIQKYIKGKRNELISYYKTGEVKRIETYNDGEFVTATCYTKSGKDTLCSEMFVMASFPGGEQALMDYFKWHIIYPSKAMKENIQGTVYVFYVVNVDGSIENVEIVKGKGVHPLLDNEAMRCVKKMPGWTPATIEGNPVRVRKVQKIKFSLKK